MQEVKEACVSTEGNAPEEMQISEGVLQKRKEGEMEPSDSTGHTDDAKKQKVDAGAVI